MEMGLYLGGNQRCYRKCLWWVSRCQLFSLCWLYPCLSMALGVLLNVPLSNSRSLMCNPAPWPSYSICVSGGFTSAPHPRRESGAGMLPWLATSLFLRHHTSTSFRLPLLHGQLPSPVERPFTFQGDKRNTMWKIQDKDNIKETALHNVLCQILHCEYYKAMHFYHSVRALAWLLFENNSVWLNAS